MNCPSKHTDYVRSYRKLERDYDLGARPTFVEGALVSLGVVVAVALLGAEVGDSLSR